MKRIVGLLMVWLLTSQNAFAELQILVTGGVDSGRPVAIPQFKMRAGGTQLLWKMSPMSSVLI